MTVETIKQMWVTFAADCLPTDAPQVQRQEMRRSFYSGCHAMLCKMHDGIGGPEVSEEEGCRILSGWLAETNQFAVDVKEGRA